MAMGRSREGPSFFTSAGARLMMMVVGGEGVAGVDDGGADALDGFLDGGLGQADDEGLLQALVGDVNLDLAGDGVDADQDEAVDFRKHARTSLFEKAGNIVGELRAG